MILLAELYFDGGKQLKRIASDFYYSKATDSIGVKEFQGRILGRPSFKSSIGCVIWGGKSATSIGDIEVVNVDGGVSHWVNLDYRDCVCVLRLVRQGASYSSSVIAQKCIIDGVERDGLNIIVKLRGTETMLERPIQSLLYDAITAAENVTLIGNSVPIVIGKVRQMEPDNIDINDLGYKISDSLVNTDVVYSGGSIANGPLESPDDYAVNDTGFVMLNNPSARITADAECPFVVDVVVNGNFNVDSAWSGNNLVAWDIDDGPGSHSRVIDVGINLTNTLSDYYPKVEASVSAGLWYFVNGEIADLTSGGIAINFGDSTPVEIRRAGRFCVVGKTGTSGAIQITALPDSDVDIRFATVYSCATDSDCSVDENVLRNLFVRAGMRIDGAGSDPDVSISASALPGYRLGIRIDGGDTMQKAIQSTLDSFCGYIRTDNAGTIRIGKYELPSGTPTVTVSRLNMVRYPKRIPDAAPGLSTRFAGGRNWSPYSDNELAGITYPNRQPFMAEYRFVKNGATATSIDRSYSHALAAPPIETMLYDEADVQTESSRICEIAQEKYAFWDIEFGLDSVSNISVIRPGTVALLDDELFEDDNGKLALITEVEGGFGNNTYRIVTWGAETP